MTTEVKVKLPDSIYNSFKEIAENNNTSVENIMMRSFAVMHVLGHNLEEDDHLCIAKFTDKGILVKAEINHIFPS